MEEQAVAVNAEAPAELLSTGELLELEEKYAVYIEGRPTPRKLVHKLDGDLPWDFVRVVAALREARGLGPRVPPAGDPQEDQAPEEGDEDEEADEDELPVPDAEAQPAYSDDPLEATRYDPLALVS